MRDSTIILMQTLVNMGASFEDFDMAVEIIDNHALKITESKTNEIQTLLGKTYGTIGRTENYYCTKKIIKIIHET